MSYNVSVIIPNYNHAKFLQQRIESVLFQTYTDFEIIILDDCSTDKSREIIENYRGHDKIIHIVYNTENSGSTFKQWTKGISLAVGKYIWIAESDDYCEHNFLEKLIEAHQQGPTAGIVYCKSIPVNDENILYDQSDWWMKRVDKNKWESNYYNTGEDECSKYLSVQCTIPNVSAVLFAADCLRNIDLDLINYKVCGDWYLYASILSNYNIIYISDSLNYHRNHFNNARNRYKSKIIAEQYEVLNHINSKFKITKSKVYYKSLDERMSQLITLMKAGEMTWKKTASLFFMMAPYDPLFFFRFLKILMFKALKIKFNFE